MKSLALVPELVVAQRLSRPAAWELLLGAGIFALGLFGLVTVVFALEGEFALQIIDFAESMLFLLAGGVPMLAMWRRSAVDARLLRDGAPASGRVVNVERLSWGQYTMWLLRYEFRDGSGAMHRGLAYDTRRIDGVRPGMRGDIRYDAARPDSSVWLGR